MSIASPPRTVKVSPTRKPTIANPVAAIAASRPRAWSRTSAATPSRSTVPISASAVPAAVGLKGLPRPARTPLRWSVEMIASESTSSPIRMAIRRCEYVFMLILSFLESCASGGLAAVDRNDCSGDEGGLLRAEPDNDVGDVARLSQPSERDGCRDRCARLLRKLFEPVGCDRAGRDRIDADAPVGVVECGGLGEADDRVLAGDVTGDPPDAAPAGARGHVDDRPT